MVILVLDGRIDWSASEDRKLTFALAFAGKIGSGKTTLTTALAAEIGCKRASFGDYVRYVVDQRGLEQTRENLQNIGTEVLELDRRIFCTNVLQHVGWRRGDSIVIDGLRHSETIDLLQELVSPAKLKIIYVTIDDDIRLDRLGVRGDGDRRALTTAESHSSEKQVNSVLAYRADLVIDGGMPIADNVRRIIDWVKD